MYKNIFISFFFLFFSECVTKMQEKGARIERTRTEFLSAVESASNVSFFMDK